jgi:hypothetical protein
VGRESAPFFDVAESAFDDVAPAVVGRVELGWASASRAPALAVADLIGRFGDAAIS